MRADHVFCHSGPTLWLPGYWVLGQGFPKQTPHPAGGGFRIPVPSPPHFTSWVQTALPSSGHLLGQDFQAGPEAAWWQQPWLAGPRAMGAGLFPLAVRSPQGGVLKEKVCKPHMECCTWSILRGHQSTSPPPPRHPGLCPSSFPLSIGRAANVSISAIWGDAGGGFPMAELPLLVLSGLCQVDSAEGCCSGSGEPLWTPESTHRRTQPPPPPHTGGHGRDVMLPGCGS